MGVSGNVEKTIPVPCLHCPAPAHLFATRNPRLISMPHNPNPPSCARPHIHIVQCGTLGHRHAQWPRPGRHEQHPDLHKRKDDRLDLPACRTEGREIHLSLPILSWGYSLEFVSNLRNRRVHIEDGQQVSENRRIGRSAHWFCLCPSPHRKDEVVVSVAPYELSSQPHLEKCRCATCHQLPCTTHGLSKR